MMKLPILSFFCLLNALVFGQFTIPEKPTTDATLVYDYANILSETEEANLNAILFPYEKSSSNQIVIATVKTINEEDINLVAANWGEKWGIGQASKDNGVLILIAVEDRKLAIQNGKGAEPKLTDAISRQIIDYEITPQFRQAKYFDGLKNGILAIKEVMSDEYKADKSDYEGGNSTQSDSSTIIFFVIAFIIFIVIIIIISKNKNNRNNDDDDDGDVIFTDYGRRSWKRGNSSGGWIFGGGSGGFGGGFGGGSSGGGFGGFGGGSFGGGGASGSW